MTCKEQDNANYKDLDASLRIAEANGVAQAANRRYPVSNLKGTD